MRCSVEEEELETNTDQNVTNTCNKVTNTDSKYNKFESNPIQLHWSRRGKKIAKQLILTEVRCSVEEEPPAQGLLQAVKWRLTLDKTK